MLSVGRVAPILSYVLVGVVALLLLSLNLDVFVVGDEVDFWLPRSERFLNAIQSGDYADTAISTHPGVTTMWLGSAGILLRRTLLAWGVFHEMPFPLMLALMRLPAALAHTAGIVGGYALLRRLFSADVALLAALLWATDPFVIAFSRVLHVDALTGTFATLSLLAAAVSAKRKAQSAEQTEQTERTERESGDAKKRGCEEAGSHTASRPVASPPASPLPGWLVLSGVCAGLAILSKSPGLAVVPVVGLLVLASSLPRFLASSLPRFLLWGGVVALTIVLVWPAVWADPARVYTLLRVGVEVEGGSPHMMGNFFLGRNDPAPGPLFYPVALVMRMTPWMLAGVVLLAFARPLRLPASSPPRLIAALAAFALLFIAGMTLFPKKFNRYIEPAFPALDILAAVGIMGAVATIARTAKRKAAVVSIIGCIALGNAAWFHPYSIAYFNQLLGGARAGANTFVVGWGEGYGQVADYLNRQPDITGVITMSLWQTTLNPYLRHGAQADGPDNDAIPDKTGYAVVYIRHVLGGQPPPPPFDQLHGKQRPLHTVTIHGVDYAWVYQVPPPVETTISADVGERATLHGYTLDTSTIRGSGHISLTLQWQARATLPNDAMLFVHLFNADGQRVAQIDVPPAGPDFPPQSWEPGRFYTWVHPLPVPPDLPAGRYRVALGLYDPDSFTRWPVARPPPPDAPDDGENVLFLEPVRVPGIMMSDE
jgi:4-amino-4-deoxy-L-arabinose transferase-like glycosyltransferase